MRLDRFRLAMPVVWIFASFLVFYSRSSVLFGQTQQTGQSPDRQLLSDPAALHALQEVVRNSGGRARWKSVQSATEVFVVNGGGLDHPETHSFQDDWSQENPKYSRSVDGASMDPDVHSGTPTFTKTLMGRKTVIPEIDPARLVVARLPAAAAELVLDDPRYVAVARQWLPCPDGATCVDVFRKGAYFSPLAPEQRWVISKATSQPISVAVLQTIVGGARMMVWKTVHFEAYGDHDGLSIPERISTGDDSKGRSMVLQSVSFNSAK